MTAHASDLAPLLAAILEAPDSLAARLAYADALADDPRGELIRVQCEAESAAAGDPRWGPLSVRSQALLAKHEKTWTAPFAHSVPWFQWRRGMIEKASAVSSRFASDPGALLAREPVTSLSLRELTRDAASKIGERPELARLRTLRIAESRLGPHIGDIVTSRLERLVELELYQAGLDDEGLERVGEAVFERLVRLEIAGQSLSQPAVTRLLGDARLAALGSLSIGWLAPGNEGAARVARHLALPSLRHLELPSQRYAHDALRVLVENPCVRRLTGLRLDQNALDAAAVEALGALRSLEDLDLSTNPIGVAGARALAITELPLRRLRLMQTHIGHAGVRALAAASFPLQILDLAYCDLDAAAASELAQTSWPLTELDLWANKIGDEGMEALSRAGFTRTMRTLTLGFCGLTDAGLAALAAGTWPALERIVFRGDAFGAAGLQALSSSPGLLALRSLKLEGMKVPKRPLAKLRERGVSIES